MPFLPELASEHGAAMDSLLLLVHLFIGVIFLFFLTIGLIALRRFRESNAIDRQPVRGRWPLAVEFGVVAGELALLFLIATPIWLRYAAAEVPIEQEPLEVRIIAQQFVWNVHYPGEDGVFGETRIELADDTTNPIGLDYDDPAAADDIVNINNLVVPVNRPIRLQMTTKDVIHSLYLPEMRVKRDIIPGMVSTVVFTPTMTTARLQEIKGDPERGFEIVCSQLCGLGHYRMRGYLRVLEEDEFEQWLIDNAPDPDYDPFWN